MDRDSRVGRLAARAVYEVGTAIGRYPNVVLPIARWRGHGEPLDGSTAVVIEGYPRSANSLVVAAFSRAQPPATRVAHHLHAPAHVIAGVRRGLPTLVLIRAPEDAVIDLVLVKRALSVEQGLRGWIRFYAPLWPLRSGFVVATTDEIAADPGTPVRRLNERFGTSFAIPEDTEEAREAALSDVRSSWERRSGPGLPLIGRTADEEDAAARDRLRGVYRTAPLRLRRRAEALYRSLTAS